jgi:hypothetical protein
MLKEFAIYLDLDGVLANYDSGMIDFGFDVDPSLKKSLNQSGTGHPLKRQMYERVKGTAFYRHLPLMSGAVELYRACYDAEPIILTASPKFGAGEDDYYVNPYWLGAAYHKRVWVETRLLPQVVGLDELTFSFPSRVPIPDERFICTTSAQKWKFMHRKHSAHQILIDDRIANVTAWAKAGGVGILHLSAEQSIAALEEYASLDNLVDEAWMNEIGVDGKGFLFDPRTP